MPKKKADKTRQKPKAPRKGRPLTDGELESASGGVRDAASGLATGRRQHKPFGST